MQKLMNLLPRKLREKIPYLDLWISIPAILLSIFGAIMIYSASSDFYILNGISARSYLMKQVMWLFLGLIVAIILFGINKKHLRSQNFIKFSTIVILFAMVGVLLFAQNTNGATGWFYIGPFGVQPSEYLKMFLILYLSNIISLHNNRVELQSEDFRKINYAPMGLATVLILLNLAEHDLGGSAINASITFAIFLAAGQNYRRSIAYIFAGVSGAYVALSMVASKIDIHTSNYMLQRLVGFAHPFQLSKGAGNQLVNSYYALGNGGIFGVGLGNSIQKKGYLPEANTDFIMAVIAEELGLIVSIFILALIFLIIARAIIIGTKSTKMYDSLVCYGIATYMTVQTFFNIGGITGLIPITGVTLPFISYGGSSMLVLASAIGVLLNISASQKQDSLSKPTR